MPYPLPQTIWKRKYLTEAKSNVERWQVIYRRAARNKGLESNRRKVAIGQEKDWNLYEKEKHGDS